jgi:hypothetical protein
VWFWKAFMVFSRDLEPLYYPADGISKVLQKVSFKSQGVIIPKCLHSSLVI